MNSLTSDAQQAFQAVPKLLIQNCWFENVSHRNQQDWRGNKVQYIKTEFEIRDESTTNRFPGVWWGHYKEELPTKRCDCIVELDYNTFKPRYEIRLIAVTADSSHLAWQSSALQAKGVSHDRPEIIDWRKIGSNDEKAVPTQKTTPTESEILIVQQCPTSWDDLRAWLRRSLFG